MTTEDVALVLAIDEALGVANFSDGRLFRLLNLGAAALSHFLELLLGVLLGFVGRARVGDCGLWKCEVSAIVDDREWM